MLLRSTLLQALRNKRPTLPSLQNREHPKGQPSPRQTFIASYQQVPVKDALNRVVAEMIAVYPPGIPCILPGELINQEMLDYIIYLGKSGIRIQGPQDPSLQYINVIQE